MRAFRDHIRALWPGLTILAIAPFVLHPFWAFARGAFHWEHAVLLVGVPALALSGERGKKLFLSAYPLGLVGILYEAMAYVKNTGLTAARVHLCDLRATEMALFGITVGGVRMTVHDWFQAHWSIGADLFCALPYGTFLFACLGFALYAYFRDRRSMQRFAWGFFAVNVVGFATYHVYPAAPPWYFHLHGCAVDLLAPSSEGPNLARVDALLGVPYFAGMYRRASDVFGAVPSLHVAYPTLIALEGWAFFGRPLRAAAVMFVAWMAFAAVYLDHHWIIDVLLGGAYAVGASSLTRAIFAHEAAPSYGRASASGEDPIARRSAARAIKKS